MTESRNRSFGYGRPTSGGGGAPARPVTSHCVVMIHQWDRKRWRLQSGESNAERRGRRKRRTGGAAWCKAR